MKILRIRINSDRMWFQLIPVTGAKYKQYEKYRIYGTFYFMSRHAGALVEAQGFSFIEDGRKFLVQETSSPGHFLEYMAESPEDAEIMLTLIGLAKSVQPISESAPCSCGECGDFFKQDLLFHNNRWMYQYLRCETHPEELAVVDAFPKVQGAHTGHDFSNAYLGFGLRNVQEDTVRWNAALLEAQDNPYLLTPNGVQRIRRPHPGWFSFLGRSNGASMRYVNLKSLKIIH